MTSLKSSLYCNTSVCITSHGTNKPNYNALKVRIMMVSTPYMIIKRRNAYTTDRYQW